MNRLPEVEIQAPSRVDGDVMDFILLTATAAARAMEERAHTLSDQLESERREYAGQLREERRTHACLLAEAHRAHAATSEAHVKAQQELAEVREELSHAQDWMRADAVFHHAEDGAKHSE